MRTSSPGRSAEARRATSWPGSAPGDEEVPGGLNGVADPDRTGRSASRRVGRRPATTPTASVLRCCVLAHGRICGNRVIDAIDRARHSGRVSAAPERRVVIVAFPGVQPLDVGRPVRGLRRRHPGRRRSAGPAGTTGHPRVQGRRARAGRERAGLGTAPLPGRASGSTRWSSPVATAPRRPRPTTALVALDRGDGAPLPPGGHGLLRRVPRPPRPGLLDGRRVTTHWARADELAAEFPAVQVDPDPIYIRDGQVLDQRRRHRRHRPGPRPRRRTTSGSTWPRPWPAGW